MITYKKAKNRSDLMLSEKEKVTLEAIGKKSLITEKDLKKIVGEGTEHAIRKLVEKNLISQVRPIGTICYVITTKGTKALRDME